MQNIRCRCGKIVCQTAGLPELPRVPPPHDGSGPSVVILCRHCKSYVILHVPAVTSIYNTDRPPDDGLFSEPECEQLHKTQR